MDNFPGTQGERNKTCGQYAEGASEVGLWLEFPGGHDTVHGDISIRTSDEVPHGDGVETLVSAACSQAHQEMGGNAVSVLCLVNRGENSRTGNTKARKADPYDGGQGRLASHAERRQCTGWQFTTQAAPSEGPHLFVVLRRVLATSGSKEAGEATG